MTDEREHPSRSEGSSRLDDLERRLAALESRLDQMGTALKTLDVSNILRQQQLVNRNHGELLAKLNKEQDSIREQTGSWSADSYEAWKPINAILAVMVIIIFFALLVK
jgi:uncharacterized coiled-coil protein SlyX